MFSFVRPSDLRVLEGRPLLDVGTGDGQTMGALAPDGFGIDRSLALLKGRRRVVCGDAMMLPFADRTFATVLAADLLHHIDDVRGALRELHRVLRPAGRLVAWWYEQPPHEAPDAPRFPRSFDEVAASADFDVEPLELEIVLGGGPPTVGLLGRG